MRKKYYKGVLESKCYFREKYIRNIKTITELKIKRQPFVAVLQTSCSSKFYKFNKKTPVLQSIFNKMQL